MEPPVREIAPNLNKYSIEDIRQAYARQRNEYDWDLSQEREFTENLFCQPFNFLLVAYSLFVTAAASTSSQAMLTVVTLAGGFVCFAVSLTIWRGYFKLMVVLRMLYRLEEHPLSMVDTETQALGWRRLFRVNPILGSYIPAFCTLSLLGAGIASWFGVLRTH
jgi:hypothetical protein